MSVLDQPLQFVAPTKEHISTLMTWFTNETELVAWSGPNFRHPFNSATFEQDLKLKSLNSYTLLGEDGALLGFGQYYLRNGRCHLARLAVSPAQRGKGVAKELIRQLEESGKKKLDVNTFSLFVMQDNQPAIKAYQKYGYQYQAYDGETPIEGCWYMVKNER